MPRSSLLKKDGGKLLKGDGVVIVSYITVSR